MHISIAIKKTKTAAKRTSVVEAYNYFSLAATPNAQKTYNENNILEINGQSILANVQSNFGMGQQNKRAITSKNIHVKWTERSDKL